MSADHWFYEEKTGFKPFKPRHSTEIEQARLAGKDKAKIRNGIFNYEIDFTSLNQRNLTTNKVRRVYRGLLPPTLTAGYGSPYASGPSSIPLPVSAPVSAPPPSSSSSVVPSPVPPPSSSSVSVSVSAPHPSPPSSSSSSVSSAPAPSSSSSSSASSSSAAAAAPAGPYTPPPASMQNMTIKNGDASVPTTFPSDDAGLHQMIAQLTNWEEKDHTTLDDDQQCPVCLELFKDVNVVTEKDSGFDAVAVRLSECNNHYYHRECCAQLYKSGSPNFIICSICKHNYGIRLGTCPNGVMTVQYSLPGVVPCSGHEKVGTFTISYSVPNGIQGPTHPNPGKAFTGTSRTAYIPDTHEGRIMLEKLITAWKRRLSFQVGTSVTTGQSDCVVWALHHKTTTSGGSTKFGWPDPTYFLRLSQELSDRGVL